jgi:hypothetical protein
MLRTWDSDGSTMTTNDHPLVTNTTIGMTNPNSPVEFNTQTSNQSSVTSLNHLRLANIRGWIPCVATENFMVEMQEWLISGSSLYCHLQAQALAMTHMLTCQPSSAVPPDGPSVTSSVIAGRCRNASVVGSLCPGQYII